MERAREGVAARADDGNSTSSRFPTPPKQKQKHEKSNINCSNCKLKSRRFFQGALACKSRFMKTNLAQTLASAPASVRARTNETTHTIFKPAFFLFNFSNGFSTQLAPPLESSSQLAVLDNFPVCVCVCDKKKSV